MSQGSLSEEEKARARCYFVVQDGVLWLNYISYVVFVNNLQGPLAKALHLRSSFFDAFTDIGSQSAKIFLEAKLKRATSDPAAAHLRSETDGPRDQVDLGRWLDDTLKVSVTQMVQARDDHWQQIMLVREDAWHLAFLDHRRLDEEWRAKWWEGMEAWRGEAQRATEALVSLVVRVSTLPFTMGQKISDVISAAVMSPGSTLIKNLRAATKKSAIRSTHSAKRFPTPQKATQVEVLGSLVSLFSVAIRHFPEMTYDVWKAVRSGFGKGVKKARLQRYALGQDSPEFIDRPLLWSFVGEGTAEGGGQRYVVLRENASLVEAVWTTPRSVGSGRRRRVESFDTEARRLQTAAIARPGYLAEAWPLLSAEVEPDFASSEEECATS